MDLRLYEVVIDCRDPRVLAAWWRDVIGWEAEPAHDDWASLRSPDGNLRIGFQRVPEPKAVKNRLHIDFAAADEEATAREIESMGASRLWVSGDPEDPFVVLADPEGNEFCIVREP